MSDIAANILTLDDALRWRRAMAEQGYKVAITNGCFDLLHRGTLFTLTPPVKRRTFCWFW